MYKILLSIVVICIICSCADSNKSAATHVAALEINESLIEKHLAKLASDEFEGRKPVSKGEEMTVNYIREQLKLSGIPPGNGTSYFQDVPLLEIDGVMAETMTISTPAKTMELKQKKDFVVHTQRKQELVGLDKSQLVFCGYGIVDEDLGWNDYAGLDMKGKTAVVLVNDPGYGSENPEFFKGNTMTYYGRWTYKYEEADRQGADGLILIHETSSAGYPWFVVESSWTGGQQGLDEGSKEQDCGIKGWITLDVAKELFSSCGQDLGKQIRAARKKGFKPVALNATATTSVQNTFKAENSKNVIAIIEGSEKPEEYIVYTAHWDHLGKDPNLSGDNIYNGALDNASGTATVLAIADAFAKAKQKPKRSTVFLFVTAEEQGLLGSEFYSNNPIYPLDKTVCNLNMDGVNPAGKMKDLTIIGMGHSEMDKIAEEEAKKQGRYVMNESEPEKGFFFRSDQFNFAKKGVPVLYAEGNYEHWDKGVEYVKEFKETYTAERYHQPSDEYSPDEWIMDGMIQDGQLFLNIGWRMSNSQEWPKWYPKSEFSR